MGFCTFKIFPYFNLFRIYDQDNRHVVSHGQEMYISIYGCTALCWTLTVFQFLVLLYSRWDALDGGWARREGRYLHTDQHKHRMNIDRHSCLKWDSNPRSQCSSGWRQFMPLTARPLWSAGDIRYIHDAWKICEMHTTVWSQNLKERMHLKILDINGRIRLKWILNKYGGNA
jgi:hypothetical protein